MDKDDKSSSRLSTSRTFPVNIHHRHRSEVTRASNNNQIQNNNDQTRNGPEERQPWPRRLFVDTSDLEPSSSNEKTTKSNKNQNNDNDNNKKENLKSHRHSKSRDHRLPRAVNQIASAGGARNLLPNRSFHRHTQSHGHPYFGVGGEREIIPEISFLKPSSSSREDPSRSSRFGSRSSSAHRNANNANSGSRGTSLVVTEEEDSEDVSRKLSLTTARGKDIKTAEDLGLARRERERGEECVFY